MTLGAEESFCGAGRRLHLCGGGRKDFFQESKRQKLEENKIKIKDKLALCNQVVNTGKIQKWVNPAGHVEYTTT